MITVKQAATKWGVTVGRVHQWLGEGRIRGAKRFGNAWVIPTIAMRPKQQKRGRKSGTE